MGQWVIGAIINLIGSIAINFGINLLKLGHDQREKLSELRYDGANRKLHMKHVIHFQTWRVGIFCFAMGNCLNFVSLAYAAQSLLAALGSVQFVSNIVFSYFVLKVTVTVKVVVATAFIIVGNISLVYFGNHQSPVYTPEELRQKYTNFAFLIYCFALMAVVAANCNIYRRLSFSLLSGEAHRSASGYNLSPCWRMLLPFSYAVISGALGSCSVLFAKSLSNMLRLSMTRNYHFHSLFTYSILLLFFATAGFWMARLNEGLSLFDAILIVPMFQIAWTFFSASTGFMYFQEYKVFDMLRAKMFVLGIAFIFVGITMLAPDDSKAQTPALDAKSCRESRLPTHQKKVDESKSSLRAMLVKAKGVIMKAKDACSVPVGLNEESINASSFLVMPMASSRTKGFRGSTFDRSDFISSRNEGRNEPNTSEEDDDHDMEARERLSLLSFDTGL
ncbi:hypothetical protein HPP92_021581 [Vanilla planifolia]|uniref:Probable magnesium transporter n=1 Tax=Vanilla planifolia TaxID=51239 RepID=A0A835PWV1_VANPL|nr:hypothetical protein HPP92_021581 [Vanilla planifolia]